MIENLGHLDVLESVHHLDPSETRAGRDQGEGGRKAESARGVVWFRGREEGRERKGVGEVEVDVEAVVVVVAKVDVNQSETVEGWAAGWLAKARERRLASPQAAASGRVAPRERQRSPSQTTTAPLPPTLLLPHPGLFLSTVRAVVSV